MLIWILEAHHQIAKDAVMASPSAMTNVSIYLLARRTVENVTKSAQLKQNVRTRNVSANQASSFATRNALLIVLEAKFLILLLVLVDVQQAKYPAKDNAMILVKVEHSIQLNASVIVLQLLVELMKFAIQPLVNASVIVTQKGAMDNVLPNALEEGLAILLLVLVVVQQVLSLATAMEIANGLAQGIMPIAFTSLLEQMVNALMDAIHAMVRVRKDVDPSVALVSMIAIRLPIHASLINTRKAVMNICEL